MQQASNSPAAYSPHAAFSGIGAGRVPRPDTLPFQGEYMPLTEKMIAGDTDDTRLKANVELCAAKIHDVLQEHDCIISVSMELFPPGIIKPKVTIVPAKKKEGP
jgi:hypothetical protein